MKSFFACACIACLLFSGCLSHSAAFVETSQFTQCGDFVNGYAIVGKDNAYGFINKELKLVVPLKYTAAEDFSDGLAVVQRSEHYGVVDQLGKETIEPKFDKLSSFINGIAEAQLSGKWGAIDKKGVKILSFIYDEVKFDGGEFRVCKNGIWGMLDKNGKTLVLPQYTYIEKQQNGAFYVIKDKKCGYIDRYGKILIPIIYDVNTGESTRYTPCSYFEGRALMKKNDIWLIVGVDGFEKRLSEYTFIAGFKDDLMIVRKGNKYGAIDKNGNIAIPVIYESAQPSYCGVVAMGDSKSGKDEYGMPRHWLLFDGGKLVFQDTYDELIAYTGEYAIVKEGNKIKLIARAGAAIDISQYSEVAGFSGGLLIVKKDGKLGGIDTTGDVAIPIVYDELSTSKDGMLRAKKDGKVGYVNNPLHDKYDDCELIYPLPGAIS